MEVAAWRSEAARGAEVECCGEFPASVLAGVRTLPAEIDIELDREVLRTPALTVSEVDVLGPPDDVPRSPVSAAAQAAEKPVATAVPIPSATAKVPIRPIYAPAVWAW